MHLKKGEESVSSLIVNGKELKQAFRRPVNVALKYLEMPYPFKRYNPAMSLRTLSAAAAGSSAFIMGRPTTI